MPLPWTVCIITLPIGITFSREKHMQLFYKDNAKKYRYINYLPSWNLLLPVRLSKSTDKKLSNHSIVGSVWEWLKVENKNILPLSFVINKPESSKSRGAISKKPQFHRNSLLTGILLTNPKSFKIKKNPY